MRSWSVVRRQTTRHISTGRGVRTRLDHGPHHKARSRRPSCLSGALGPGARVGVRTRNRRAGADRESLRACRLVHMAASRSQRSPFATNTSKSESNETRVVPREIAIAARCASSIAWRCDAMTRREAPAPRAITPAGELPHDGSATWGRSRRTGSARPRSSTAALEFLQCVIIGHLRGHLARRCDLEREANPSWLQSGPSAALRRSFSSGARRSNRLGASSSGMPSRAARRSTFCRAA